MQIPSKIVKPAVMLLVFTFLFSQWPGQAWALDKYPVQWDLTQLVESEEQWNASCQQARQISQQIAEFKGHLVDADAILTLRDWNEKFANITEPLLTYAQLCYSLDPADPEMLQQRAQIYQIIQEYQSAKSYVDEEIYALPMEVRKKIFNDSRLLPYSYYYEQYINEEYQALPESIAKMIQPYQIASQQFINIYDILSYVELPDPHFILPDGQLVTLNTPMYHAVLQNDFDRDVKLNAYKTYFRKYNHFENTFAAIYQGKISDSWANAKLCGYSSTREYAMALENIPESVYLLMHQTVRSSLGQLQEFLRLHQQGIGEEVQYPFDLARSSSDYTFSPTYDQAVDRVREALSVLGVDYIRAYNQLVTSQHIDVYPAQNKNAGSYTTQSISGLEPRMNYIMLNFQGAEEDISTFAHEAGHALYGWFSQEEQPKEYQNPTVFTHEVASTTNELLYYMYSIDHAATEQERLYYLEKGLHLFYNTLFMQMLYAEFEDFAFQVVESGQPLTSSILNDKWNELYQAYQGDAVKKVDGLKGQWAQIPHFFESDFYVYKYACDICYASVLAQKIYSGDAGTLQNYHEFLKKGSSQSPADLLAGAGVDVFDPLTYQEAMNLFVQWMNQYASIIRE